jgi:hypothetical protein
VSLVLLLTVSLLTTMAPFDRDARAAGTPVVAVVDTATGPQLRTFVVSSSGDLARLRARPDVLAAGSASTRSLPAFDPVTASGFPDGDWGLARLGGERITAVGTGVGVVVAVLDTGVDAAHPELRSRVLPGKDFVDPAGDGRRDPNGHGTHVAGIVAAAADGSGTTGVAPAARILPVRVLAADGIGDDGVLALGIVWAAENGADIMNLSIGGAVPSTLLEDAIRFAFDRGVLVVISAGNDGAFSNTPSYPAAYPDAFAVGSTDAADRRSIFSNTGAYLDIAAPGSWIRSTWPGGGYQVLSGTSMAAPFVSGAAAVTLERTGLRGRDLAARLTRDAFDLGAAGRDDETGSGLVNPLAIIGEPLPALPSPNPSLPALPPLPPLPTPQLPALPQLPNLPAPTLPSLPVLPTPTLPTPTWPGLPALPARPNIPGTGTPSTPPVSGFRPAHVVKVVLTSRATTQGRQVSIRLEGAPALVANRRLEVVVAGRRTRVVTGWKGTATIRVRRGASVSVRLPASALHPEASASL